MENDAKQTTVDPIDEAMDLYDGGEAPEPGSSSGEKAEPETSDEPKSEDATSQKSEDKGDKEAEGDKEVPKGFHNHPAWQRIIRERDEAIARLDGKKEPTGELPADVAAKLEKFEKVTSSPEFIRASMKADGYTDERISAELKARGYETGTSKNDVDLVLSTLGINKDALNDEQKRYVDVYVADMVTVANALLQQKLEPILNQRLEPLQKELGEIKQVEIGNKLYEDMVKTVKAEGILDFEKDVTPKLDEYLKANPKATQEDIRSEFDRMNHTLVIERLRTKGKKDARDEKKAKVGDEPAGLGTTQIEAPKRKDGQDVSSYMDDLLDHFGYKR